MLTHIPTVPHREALMLVRATAPSRWTAHYLAQRLYVTQATAADVLADLNGSGLLQRDDATATYYYQCRQNAIGNSIEQLAAIYANNLVEITVLIHAKMNGSDAGGSAPISIHAQPQG